MKPGQARHGQAAHMQAGRKARLRPWGVGRQLPSCSKVRFSLATVVLLLCRTLCPPPSLLDLAAPPPPAGSTLSLP